MRTAKPQASRRPILAAIAVVAAAALSTAAPASAAAGDSTTSYSVTQSPQEVRSFWTPERMRAAEPLELSAAPRTLRARRAPAAASLRPSKEPTLIPPTGGASTYDYEPGTETGFPARVHGKVFFSTLEGEAMCSGTLVSSRLQNVVFTAAHCVADAGAFVNNLAFVPGYRDGTAPFGVYPAAGLLAPDQWLVASSLSHDAAIVQLGVPLEAQLGARGVAFNKAPRSTYQIFGYPARPAPYDGERLIACDASFLELQYTGYPFSTTAFPCNMMQGSSGGGWVTPSGHVTSVVSHGSCDFDPSTCGQISGPYFGDAVKALYRWAGGSAQCPPAKLALKTARKKVKRAKKAAKRASSDRAERKADRRLRKSLKKHSRADSRHDEVC